LVKEKTGARKRQLPVSSGKKSRPDYRENDRGGPERGFGMVLEKPDDEEKKGGRTSRGRKKKKKPGKIEEAAEIQFDEKKGNLYRKKKKRDVVRPDSGGEEPKRNKRPVPGKSPIAFVI